MTSDKKGRLIVVATPIGNLSDLSPRGQEALTNADLWIVEDTRVSGKLAFHFGVKKPMRVVNDHTTAEQIERVLKDVSAGVSAALLTDGGSPVVSDPGASLIDRAYQSEIEVSAIPGPSAPILALTLSGFFGQRFAFLGFLGRKPKDMRKELVAFADSALTLILFESPHRVDSLLQEVFTVLGARRYVICREMTKLHEQVYRGTLPSIPTIFELPRRGEVTLVVEGLRRK
jgi:16S rRNA (cytidine1402-2'-O)-methyltransferase